MKTLLAAFVAASLGLGLLSTPAQATHRHRRHHRGRYHRTYYRTRVDANGGYYVNGEYYVNGVRHTHPSNDVDKVSRSFNHEVVNASKSFNHLFQGKKPTPQGYR